MHFAGIGSQTIADHWSTRRSIAAMKAPSISWHRRCMINHVVIGADPCVRFDSDLSL